MSSNYDLHSPPVYTKETHITVVNIKITIKYSTI
jgi:hypothetical protein